MTNNQECTTCSDAKRLLQEGDYEQARDLLVPHISEHDAGEPRALLALVHFQLAEYEQAVEHCEAALRHDPSISDWEEMLVLSRRNVFSGVMKLADKCLYDAKHAGRNQSMCLEVDTTPSS